MRNVSELGSLSEHWTNWIARKSHRTHFLFPGKSSPPYTNTPGLYDGGAEARGILVDAMAYADESLVIDHGYEILESALNYLKGKDLSPERFSYTENFFGPTPEEWLAQVSERTVIIPEPLVQISPLPVSDQEPMKLNPADSKIFIEALLAAEKQDPTPINPEDMHAEEYPEWSVQNQRPLDEDNPDVCPLGG